MGLKIWVSKDKKMVAVYTEKACVDIWLDKDYLKNEEIAFEYYIGDRLIRRDVDKVDKEIDFEKILEFLKQC